MIIVLEADVVGGVKMMYEGVLTGRHYSQVVGWSKVRGLGHYDWLQGFMRSCRRIMKLFMKICVKILQ